jgi:alpha-beta hydrolase superfamily lysophospholipase
MQTSSSFHTASDGKPVHVYRFLPDGPVRAVLHLAHGLCEHAGRYERLAQELTARGIAVYANDHRGHGKTAATDEELGFFQGGVPRVLADLVELVSSEKHAHPGVPFVMMGHSMGSFLVQELMITHGAEFQAAVLSGSNGKPNLLAAMGRSMARFERWRLGPQGKSALIRALAFDAFNKPFGKRTAFEWLSRDTAEVDKYVADPRCGFDATTELWVGLLDLLAQIAIAERQARIPSRLPVYVFAGAEDTSSDRTKGLAQLLEAYQAAGVRSVQHKFYEGARHETLNETNRAEVTADLLAWLEGVLAS